MSGMKNLALSVVTDPSFKTDGLMSVSEAKKYVSPNEGPKPPKFPAPGKKIA